jgi:hypothetical protein
MASDGMKYVPDFMTIHSGIQVKLRLFPYRILGVVVLVLLMGGIRDICHPDGLWQHEIRVRFYDN